MLICDFSRCLQKFPSEASKAKPRISKLLSRLCLPAVWKAYGSWFHFATWIRDANASGKYALLRNFFCHPEIELIVLCDVTPGFSLRGSRHHVGSTNFHCASGTWGCFTCNCWLFGWQAFPEAAEMKEFSCGTVCTNFRRCSLQKVFWSVLHLWGQHKIALLKSAYKAYMFYIYIYVHTRFSFI